MKKLFALMATAFICVFMCSCATDTPGEQQQRATLPSVPDSFFSVTEITSESMQILESKVQQLTVTDFLHTEKIAQLEKQGVTVSVKNITLLDCNNISFDLVLKRRFGDSIVLPAKGVLMYGYVPGDEERIYHLSVAWGNVSVFDNVIALANIDTLSFWNADTMEPAFRQPKVELAQESEFFFILDVVKGKNGFTMPYFSSDSCGLVNIGLTGDVFDTPVKYETNYYRNVFGMWDISESAGYNTTSRVITMLNCFYTDETENQFMISLKYADGHFGTDYMMYDFIKNTFVSSVDVVKYNIDGYSYNLYSMCLYEGVYRQDKDTLYFAEKYKDGLLEKQLTLNMGIGGMDFGSDRTTGWNNPMYVNLSEDYNTLRIGCSKTDTVIDLDFTRGAATVEKSSKMPQMHLMENSPNTAHNLYKVWNKNDTTLAVRCLMGDFEMDGLTQVSGQQGKDWLAGFKTHKYIYVLTETRFLVYKRDGSNYWLVHTDVNGSFNVDKSTAADLCKSYIRV